MAGGGGRRGRWARPARRRRPFPARRCTPRRWASVTRRRARRCASRRRSRRISPRWRRPSACSAAGRDRDRRGETERRRRGGQARVGGMEGGAVPGLRRRAGAVEAGRRRIAFDESLSRPTPQWKGGAPPRPFVSGTVDPIWRCKEVTHPSQRRRPSRGGRSEGTMSYTRLPAPSPEQGLSRYLQEIRKFPMLEPEEEYMLAKAWVDHGDRDSAHKLVTSHLRLAAKIAMGYRGYGLPPAEVISEANVGLMQAVKRFDPERGFRLATYAMWWIRAAIQEYILRSWSLVKLGTTSAQKKLFFNLRKAKARIGALEEGDLRPENVQRIAHDLGVTEDEVISMNRRLSGGDASLNATVGSEDDSATQWQDWLEDEGANQAEEYAEKDEFTQRIALMGEAMDVLNERERDILTQRRLSEET